MHDSIRPSTIHLPNGSWRTVLDCLAEHFPHISRDLWRQRIERKRVLDATGAPIHLEHPYQQGLRIQYFREVEQETVVPFKERILYQDEHILVADKPHFLPVMPSGQYVQQTLMARLIESTGNRELSPLHRIDRLTAGLVLFSCNPASRNYYQALFRQQKIEKDYLAVAKPLPHLHFPYRHLARMEPSEPFFRMQQAEGVANSETWIDVIARTPNNWLYRLKPVSGKKHQLRVHMASLGAALLNDPFYPSYERSTTEDNYQEPLQLLAYQLHFIDPLRQIPLQFQSQQQLILMP